MAKNIAVRRAAKAQRRKAVVAQKRKAEINANSTDGQVRLASTAPVQHCLVSGALFDTGIGTLVLARGATPYNVTVAVFLLDTFALGVKDVFVRQLDDRAFAGYVDRLSILTPMKPVDPAYARKLLHDLTDWSRDQGFSPHPEYAAIERLFGTTDPGGSDAVFAFGNDGKPLVIADLSDVEAGWFEVDDEDTDNLTIDGEAETSPGMERVEHSPAAAHGQPRAVPPIYPR